MRATIGLMFTASLVACSPSQPAGSGKAGDTGTASTVSSAANPLIGSWTSDDPENGCAQRVVFDARTSSAHYGAVGVKAAYDSDEAVSYVVDSPTKVTAVGEGSGAGGEIWVFSDANHAKTGSADQCGYTRG